MNGEAVVLGFDTSCYTTSVAAVDLAGRPVASCRRLLPVPSGERGLRQSEAVFIHCLLYTSGGKSGSGIRLSLGIVPGKTFFDRLHCCQALQNLLY